ncbi:MAG: XTP/dITP diphosphohydrolase [Methylobacteriaceae bacterium]|jgi:XTP/dITP diphosphohydrolase|nr:XTP/dITP diphosphohydrolase [Methylobacteriaceae bacterium]
MGRQITGRLVIATHNSGKLWEMRELLAPYGVDAISASDLSLAEPDETGTTFAENARIKAEAAARAANLPAFADDSGLCVEALGGAPGIYSARWAGEARDFGAAIRKVQNELKERAAAPPFRAAFVSALCVVWPDGHTDEFEGGVDGELIFPPRGSKGFGYDPIFLPEGRDKTFGEMMSVEKHAIPADGSRALSHRARAFQALAKSCLHCSG